MGDIFYIDYDDDFSTEDFEILKQSEFIIKHVEGEPFAIEHKD